MSESPPQPEATLRLSRDTAVRCSLGRDISAGEQEVIDLYDELRNRLLRYLFSFSLGVSDSEDIVQEAFLALFQHLQNGKSRENLRGWLFRVAHNLALKHLQIERHPRNATEGMMMVENSAIDLAPSPEDQFANNQKQRRLMAVLHALPEQNRWCLHLRAEGLRYREIAEVLGISLGTVSVCLERSLAQIARATQR